MKCYLLVTGDLKRRQPILDYIDKVPEITSWHTASGGILFASEKEEEWLADKIHEGFPYLVFLIVPLDFYSCRAIQIGQHENLSSWPMPRLTSRIGRNQKINPRLSTPAARVTR